MRKCDNYLKIPDELRGNDVYNMLYIFEDKNEAIDFIVKEYKVDKDLFLTELHEDDYIRDELGKENYLRSANVKFSCQLVLSELMNGEYILWEAY